MSEPTAVHATFSIERHFNVAPERVFAAFADPESKARWFVGPDNWQNSNHSLEFIVGGKEHVSGGPPGGPVHSFDATYQDIVPNRRIIIAYEDAR